MKDRIYLDHAATTPVSPEVLEAMTECMHDVWGNASGVYGTGRDSRRAIDRARRQVADALGAQGDKRNSFCNESQGESYHNYRH